MEFENTSQNMYLQDGEGYIEDKFSDEISIGIKTNRSLSMYRILII